MELGYNFIAAYEFNKLHAVGSVSILMVFRLLIGFNYFI